jgi:hypothetical protein
MTEHLPITEVLMASSSSSRNSSRGSAAGSDLPAREVLRHEVGGQGRGRKTERGSTDNAHSNALMSEVSDVLAGQGGASCWRRKPTDLVAAAAR